MKDWKETTVARRDERQTKLPDIRSPSSSRKDTKRWCRGKVGREHNPMCVPYDEWKNSGTSEWSKHWKLLICSECNKQLDYWWPLPWHMDSPPDWAPAT